MASCAGGAFHKKTCLPPACGGNRRGVVRSKPERTPQESCHGELCRRRVPQEDLPSPCVRAGETTVFMRVKLERGKDQFLKGFCWDQDINSV
jgi:hypothetical protein